jgi:hypothetical protein
VSHYTVIVALDLAPRDSAELTLPSSMARLVDQRLAEVLAPFDESIEVEAYRKYEEGEPGDFWLINALRRAAEEIETNTGILPYKPDEFGWSSAWSKDTPEVQRRKQEQDAAAWYVLPADLTWAHVVELYNGYWEDGPSDELFLSEDGRAYALSTYNPKSKWDWYQVGGRWRNSLRIKPAYVGDPAVIGSPRGWSSPEEPDSEFTCDGAPKGMLDFAGMRALAAHKAETLFDEYHALIAGTPVATPWEHFTAEVKAKRMTIEQARTEYHAQARVVRIREAENRKFSYFSGDAMETYERPKAEVVAQAVNEAIPMYALVTLDGEWREPGEMGWFGVSTDTPETKAEHYRAANEYIESLADDVVLVLVDVHI